MKRAIDRKRVSTDGPKPAERRRIATVKHDDRGNASVEWQDAPPDYDRPKLELLEDAPRGRGREQSFDPYGRDTTPKRPAKDARPARTDLRKLSEWIKMMRDLEARKKGGGESDEGNDKG